MGILTHAGIFALASMFMGLVPMGMGILYAASPNEQRLALMRPLSLAAIFAALSGTSLGVLHVLMGIVVNEPAGLSRLAAVGLAEALVPTVFGFGCLTIAWLCVALGLWRRP